jgi:hypothetical protein
MAWQISRQHCNALMCCEASNFVLYMQFEWEYKCLNVRNNRGAAYNTWQKFESICCQEGDGFEITVTYCYTRVSICTPCFSYGSMFSCALSGVFSVGNMSLFETSWKVKSTEFCGLQYPIFASVSTACELVLLWMAVRHASLSLWIWVPET